MKVYALTGKSGTGKSHNAMRICKDKNINALIDDGLFIYNDKVEAGRSAKKEPTKLGAIRTAVFTKTEHREQVASRIKAINPESILILGTSDGMVDKVTEQLGIPPVSEYIHIEDITTEKQREYASKQRHLQGKHVIPVPTMQVKRDFAGYFIDPLRIVKNPGRSPKYEEKTVVRPTYSYFGEYFLADTVLFDIAKCVADECSGIKKIYHVYENTSPEALCLTVVLGGYKSRTLWENMSVFQRTFAEQVEAMTAFNVVKVDIQVKKLSDREILF